jgi:4-amino-4-deoxy-L-arabinose transferase-like glycosyltransferase
MAMKFKRLNGMNKLRPNIELHIVAISIILFLIFAVVRIVQYCVIESRCLIFNSNYFLFFIALLVSICLISISRKMSDRWQFPLLMIVACIMIGSTFMLSYPQKWTDEVGYYKLAILTHDKGIPYIFSNWSSLEASEYADRTLVSTPVWPSIMSLFMFLGQDKIITNIVEWLFAIGTIIAVYFIAKVRLGKKNASLVSFIFLSIPVFLLNSTTPMVEIPLTFFSAWMFLLLSLYRIKGKIMYLGCASLLFSLAFLMKFNAAILVLPAIVLLYNKNIFKVRDISIFFIVALILPLSLMVIGYSFIDNMQTAQAFHEKFVTNAGVATGYDYIIKEVPKAATHYGFPLLLLILFAGMSFQRNSTTRILTFTTLISMVILAFIVIHDISRYLLVLAPLFTFPLMANHKIIERNAEMMFIISCLQTFLFSVLPGSVG